MSDIQVIDDSASHRSFVSDGIKHGLNEFEQNWQLCWGVNLQPWPVPSPRSPTARQKYHRHAGLTSCSTPWMDSGDCLQFLLLLKADMLEGQTEFNQNWSAHSCAAFPEKVCAATSGRTDTFSFQTIEAHMDRKSQAGQKVYRWVSDVASAGVSAGPKGTLQHQFTSLSRHIKHSSLLSLSLLSVLTSVQVFSRSTVTQNATQD